MRDYATGCASLGLLGSLSQESYILCHKEHSKHVYIRGVTSPHLTLQMHAQFNAKRADKINDCGFNLSVACDWRVLIEEDKDNSLKLAKVFLAKFLKLPIRQSFPPPPFCAIQYYFIMYETYLDTFYYLNRTS